MINIMMRYIYLVLIISGSFPACAEIYKWTDDNGGIHFGDQRPESHSVEKVNVSKINSYTQVTIENNVSSSIARTRNRTVVMYSTSWCGYCKKARSYFQANRIKFMEYDIEKSKKGKREYDALGGAGVPVILVGDRRMNGFSEEAFNKIYN